MKPTQVMPLIVAGMMMTATAQAHVRFEKEVASNNSYMVGGLLVPHGCGESATVKITLEIADGVSQVTPRQIPGWTVSVTKRALEKPIMLRGFEVHETVDTVTWSGGNLPSFAFQRFDVHMKLPDAADSYLYFPVTQTCTNGEMHWANIPAKDDEMVPEPAPRLHLRTK